MTVFWVVAVCSLKELVILVMEAVSTFEVSVSFCETVHCNIPEDSHLYFVCGYACVQCVCACACVC
jgi:hypothetical protein